MRFGSGRRPRRALFGARPVAFRLPLRTRANSASVSVLRINYGVEVAAVAAECCKPGVACPTYYRRLMKGLNAGIGGIGPFQLHHVAAERLGFPCADVADFAVGVVVPALPGSWIGDGFAQFVGRSRSQRIEGCYPAQTTGAARIRHHCILEAVGRGIVIAAEICA
jgi:hypothetical protein